MDDDERKHAIFMEQELRNTRNEIAAMSWFVGFGQIATVILLVLILWRVWG